MQAEEKEADVQKIVSKESNIVWLPEISKKDIKIAGGKGANLAEMYNLDLNVPPAFIVTTNAFNNFMKSTGLNKKVLSLLDGLNIENTKELEITAAKIREEITNQKVPEELQEEIIEAYSSLTFRSLCAARNHQRSFPYAPWMSLPAET